MLHWILFMTGSTRSSWSQRSSRPQRSWCKFVFASIHHCWISSIFTSQSKCLTLVYSKYIYMFWFVSLRFLSRVHKVLLEVSVQQEQLVRRYEARNYRGCFNNINVGCRQQVNWYCWVINTYFIVTLQGETGEAGNPGSPGEPGIGVSL